MSDQNNDLEQSSESKISEVAEVSRKAKLIKEVKSIILILLGVFAFRSTFFEPFRIPSGSMIPTLMIGDFILVNKLSYGIKVPFTDIAIFDYNFDPVYPFGSSKPERGDVVVFKFPKDPSVNYIKRVVGVPGDEIEIVNKVVYVNGEPIKTEEIDGKEIMEDMDEKFKGYSLKFYRSNTGKSVHLMQQDTKNQFKVDHEKMIVPKGKYFVMGDNRDFSYDSRFWKFVPFENIKGKAIMVWFSMIIPFLDDHRFKFRPWRIGTIIN